MAVSESPWWWSPDDVRGATCVWPIQTRCEPTVIALIASRRSMPVVCAVSEVSSCARTCRSGWCHSSLMPPPFRRRQAGARCVHGGGVGTMAAPDPLGRRRTCDAPARARTPALAGARDGVAELRAADSRVAARPRRRRRVLDVHLHQLAAHAALRAGVGGEVPGRGAGRDRGALTG